jgi:MFS family permease
VADFELILVLRGLQGVGYTAFNAVTVAMLGDRLRGQPESAAQGVRVLLNKTTGFVGPTVAGVLAAVAWYYPFYLYGLAVPAGLLVYHYLEPVATDPDGGEDRRSLRSYLDEMAALVRDPFIAAVLAGGFFRMVLKYALYSFLPLAVVHQYGGSLGYAGFLVGLYSLIGAVVASQSARFTGRLSHAYALVAGFLVAAVAFVAFPLAGGIAAVTVLVLVHGVGEGVINPVHKSVMSQSVAADVRAGLVTSNAIVQNTAKTVTPVVLGWLLVVVGQDAYDQLFLLTGAVTLVAAVVALAALAVGRPSARRASL